jgi:GNAT superfamily N-acetyltransferase
MNGIDDLKTPYTITRLSNTNITDLAKLYTAVYGKEQPQNYFRLKYDTAYTGAEFIGFIAYHREAPIAFYGVIPCFIVNNGSKLLTAQSADTMTHPDYRNKGLFVELANLTFQLCKAVGIGFVFGFPNQNSLPGFINKLGWQMTQRMACFVIPIKTLPLERISIKIPALKKVYARYNKLFLNNYLTTKQGIPSSALADGFGGLLRDDNYLKSKAYSPRIVIDIAGTEVWLRINNGLLVGDITVTETAFPGVMNKLKSIARMLGLSQLQFHVSEGTTLHRLLSAQSAPVESFPVIFKDLDAGVDTSRIKFTLADIDIF